MPVPECIRAVVAPFRPRCTAPTWSKRMTGLMGTLLARGPRTVCAALRLRGEANTTHWSSSHQVLTRARWSVRAASRCVLVLIVGSLLAGDAVGAVALDDTLERRWGPEIHTRGHDRERALSSRKRSVSRSGRRWIVMAVSVPVPWSERWVALPCLVVLATTPSVRAEVGRAHHTVAQRARQMIRLRHRWLPDRQIRVVGETASSCVELGMQASRCGVTLLTPAWLESVLHAPPPLPAQRRNGGTPQVGGTRVPSRQMVRDDPATCWQQSPLPWDSLGLRTGAWCSGTALWDRIGHPPFPIRWVRTRDPEGKRPVKALVCPDLARSADAIILSFTHRWPLETTVEERRAHLGIETQRQ